MSTDIILNNYSDDAQIKKYISNVLMPRVFHDIPLNVLNTGAFSIINEYMSQAIEQQAFTSSFYFNESFITKALLADSIYAEAAIFNIGYSFASPSTCNFLLELKIEDIYNNAKLNSDNGLYEFILDKNTKFNLSNGSVYSLDYDVLIQYKNVETSSRSSSTPAWNIQYTNLDSQNSIARNKNVYIMYRVTDVWLCMFITASEFERNTHTVVNNMTNGIPNADKVITCNNHICGFDVKYIDENGDESFLDKDHILPLNATAVDSKPYIHYIMDNPQTIRFIFQLNGLKYFVPALNSSYEITMYTCHGESANFTAFKNDEQPSILTSANKYSNNANVMKASFVISGSVGGTNIGTIETVRRETIEAYNTANVISTDHDIDEWFKTFYFKNILYPFFFKRRDDPSGRVWSGYLALSDKDDYVFKTNTLHFVLPYDIMYNNNDNTVSSNEIIIPPGLIWTYSDANRFTVVPYIKGDGITIETAKTLANINDKFVFSNPFGIRIQKQPFAIGYFNPWINDYVSTTKINDNQYIDNEDDLSIIYHATPIVTNIKRTYKDDYYKMTTYVSPTISNWVDGSPLVRYVRNNAIPPIFVDVMWNYFNKPLDLFTASIPILPLSMDNGFIPFDNTKTYFCVRNRRQLDDGTWSLSDIWIDDLSTVDTKRVMIPITGSITRLYGEDKVWGNDGLWIGHEVYISGESDITLYASDNTNEKVSFKRVSSQNYYELRLNESMSMGTVESIFVTEVTDTDLTKYGEIKLTKIGKSYSTINIKISFSDGTTDDCTITNASNVYMPYTNYEQIDGGYLFHLDNVTANEVMLYADMKPMIDSGAVDYYRIPFSSIPNNVAMFYIENKLLQMDLNNMRVVLHASVNGSETGMVEMQPVQKESDGSYRYEVNMQPLNEMVDLDNRINIASITNGGGSWKPATVNSVVNVDATHPEFKISIFIRSESNKASDINDPSFDNFRLVDQYTIDDISLIQELKEMRSVVNFGESSVPTEEQMALYKDMIALAEYDETVMGNIWTLTDYSYKRMNDIMPDNISFDNIKLVALNMKTLLTGYLADYVSLRIGNEIPYSLQYVLFSLTALTGTVTPDGSSVDWETMYNTFFNYKQNVVDAFDSVNVNGGMEVQLVPFVEYSLMNSERFESFVSSFTQVHKAIEPVIFNRLEGNNYLDCKLIATYGKPHSYSSDLDYRLENVFWPDLNTQIEFDVKLYNPALATNTINELRLIIKSYFNRLTSIHTPVDLISMNNNIYISHVIQQMESHANVAYMKFIGWYTNEKGVVNGNYMDANTQAIVQKWRKLEDFPKQELERFVPEMFILEDKNIVINLI